MKIAGYLDEELRKLHEEDVLTRVDVEKMIDDSKLSAQAVINAINKANYPEKMQRELVDRLIGQYEASIEDILDEARGRRYSLERIEARLISIERKAFPDLDEAIQRRLLTKQQKDEVSRFVKEQHNEFLKGIKSIPQKHPKRLELIETWFVDYEGKLQKFVQRFLPKLADQLETLHQEPRIVLNDPPIEQKETLTIKKKGFHNNPFRRK
jgi:hypothetical protein